MSALSHQLRQLARLGRRRRMATDERGFTLIETVTAIVILAILAVGLIGLVESAIVTNTLGRQRTVAQQMAQDQVEWIRQLDYNTEVGTPGGNPNGIVPVTKSITVRGLEATMTTDVDWVADTTPGTYATFANYKKITVRVTSNRNGAVLTSIVTYVAPPGRSPTGGLSNAIINVKVQDMGYVDNTYMSGVQVDLATGPSAPISDVTDSNGLVTFPGLTPNPTSGPTAYYDLSAVEPSGYVTYVDDRVPGPSVHIQVAPSETKGPQVIRLYKPATVDVALTDSAGNPYVGAATIKATSQRLGITKSYASAAMPITSFNGDPVVPGDFTLRAYTSSGGLCSDPVAKYVPDAYPTTMTSTFTLQLVPCPMGSLKVNVTQFGVPSTGSTVTIKDGPNDYLPITQTTDTTGATTFTNLPSGSDQYTITVTDPAGNVTATGTATVATGATTNTTIDLADPPMGTISADVHWLGVDVDGATVQVTGGPYGISLTGTTSTAGIVNFSNLVPAGSGYTVTATKNGVSKTASGVSVTAGSTTVVLLNMPTANLVVDATWLGQSVGSGASVSVSGGPDAANGPYTGTTNSSGQAVITVPETASPYSYTVSASKSGGSGTAAVTTVPSTGASVSVAFTQIGTIRVTTTWAGAGSSGAVVTITGGPLGGTYSGTTDTTGVATIQVPASSSAYTVTAVKSGVTVSGSVSSVADGATVNLSLSFTRTFNIRVRRSSTNITTSVVTISGGPASVTISVTGNNTSGKGQSGLYTMLDVPVGSGYTIKAYGPCGTNPDSRTHTGVTISVSQGQINETYNSNTCPV